jgi:hypothetical protein
VPLKSAPQPDRRYGKAAARSGVESAKRKAGLIPVSNTDHLIQNRSFQAPFWGFGKRGELVEALLDEQPAKISQVVTQDLTVKTDPNASLT